MIVPARAEEGGRWALAVGMSLALHAAALVGMSSPHEAPMGPPRDMTVALRVLAPPASTMDQGGPPAPTMQETPAQPAKPRAQPKPTPKPKAEAQPKAKPKPKAHPAPAPKTQAAPSAPAPAAATAPQAPVGGGRAASRPGPAVGGARPRSAPSGGVVDVSSLKVVRRVKPAYPALARKRGEEGTAVLIVTLEGPRPTSVKIEKSSGSAALDGAARDAVSKWSFENAGGLRVRVPVTFRLK